MVSTSPLRLAWVAAGSAVTSSAAFCGGTPGHVWRHERYARVAAHERHRGKQACLHVMTQTFGFKNLGGVKWKQALLADPW